MKTLAIINKGSRVAWSPYGLAIKSLIGGALILTGLQSTLQAQEVQFSKPSWYFGVAGGANVNFLRGTTQELNSELTVPAAFHDGNGVGLYVAPLIEYHRPDTRLGLMLQVGYDSRKGSFNEVLTPCNCPADLNTDLSYLTVEPSLRFAPFKSNFYLYGGPRFAFNLSKSFTYKQGVNPAYPLQVANPDVTGDFSNVNDNLISMQIGAGYDIPLSSQRHHTQFVLSPFVSYQPYFGQDPRSIESLNVTTLRAGVALKLGRGHKIAPPVVEQIPVAIPAPEPKPEPKVEPVPVVEVKVVRPVVIGNVYKVYFGFDKWNLDARTTADLNQLAIDMNANPSVNVEIESHTDSRGAESYNMKLSEKRGKSVIDYLTGKGIKASRINAHAYGETRLINKCADGVPCTNDEHAVNRRTESTIIE
jgi:outer membrane protein OmpA-like peptidoglycan-associated protein